jgi:uncharacterized Zn finger protein
VSEVKTFFRSCPACGRRFQLRLVNKKHVGTEVVKETLTLGETPLESLNSPAPINYPLPTPLEEGEPILVDIEEFQYTYNCKHCGHVWTEEHDEEHVSYF